MRRILLIGLLGAIVLAGCTSDNGTTPSGNGFSTSDEGLSIEFVPVSTDFNAGSDAVFDITVENVGEGPATLTSMQLFGPSWVSSGNAVFSGSAGLRPVEVEEELPGDRRQFEVSRSVPDISDESVNYEVGLRTRFDYVTESRSTIELLTPEEYQSRDVNQETMSQSSWAAPITVRFDGNTPLEYGGDESARVPISVENTGGGEVIGENVTLSVYPESDTSSPLLGCNEATVPMFDGSGQIDCEIESYSMSGFAESVTLIANATYTYEDEKRTVVTVRG